MAKLSKNVDYEFTQHLRIYFIFYSFLKKKKKKKDESAAKYSGGGKDVVEAGHEGFEHPRVAPVVLPPRRHVRGHPRILLGTRGGRLTRVVVGTHSVLLRGNT